MKLLLHICCAPCSVACIQSLRAEGIEPTGYWFNPNIHPFVEYRTRRDTLKDYAARIGLALTVNDTYGLRPFVRAVAEDIGGRCPVCYAARMRETARYAAANGFTHFTSTLFISPYQRHNLLRAAAEEAAQAYGVAFLYRDFRPLFRAGQEEARALELYMQKYCGCVFSEEERYSKRYRVKPNRKPPAADGGAAQTAPVDDTAVPDEAKAAAERLAARDSLRRAGLAFEAALHAEAGAPPAETALPSRADAAAADAVHAVSDP